MAFDLDSFISELNGGNAAGNTEADPFAGSEPVAAEPANTPAPAATVAPGHDTAAAQAGPPVATGVALMLLAQRVAAIEKKLAQNGWHI